MPKLAWNMQSEGYHWLKGYFSEALIVSRLYLISSEMVFITFIAKDLPMQAKHLIIIAITGIVALAAFNIVNKPTITPEPAIATTTEAAEPSNKTIAEQPLSQQPKAIVDKATNDIAAAQQLENDKIATATDTAQ